MKINGKKGLSLLSTLLVVLAFTFSINTNAATNSTNAMSTPLNLTASVAGSSTTLTFGFWKWWKKLKHPKHPKQPKQPKRPKHPKSPKGGDQIPLDGGLGILVLGAAAFGVRKLRSNKNDKS